MKRFSILLTRHSFSILIVVLGFVLFANAAQAQTVIINPATSTMQFTASPDHNVLVGGTAVVTGYKAVYCLLATPTQCQAPIDLGKPTPDANNVIALSGVFSTVIKNTEYVAQVYATGPGGDGVPSAASNPFALIGSPRSPGTPIIKR